MVKKIKKWDLAENYQARAFRQVRGLKLPESIPRYRYNCIDIILSIWVYRYHYIDRLLSIGCYRICVRLYGGGVRLLFVCAIYIKQPAIFVQIAEPKKIAVFAYNGNKNYWRLPHVFDIIQASRGGRTKGVKNRRDARQAIACTNLENSIDKSLSLPHMPLVELWGYSKHVAHGRSGNTLSTYKKGRCKNGIYFHHRKTAGRFTNRVPPLW